MNSGISLSSCENGIFQLSQLRHHYTIHSVVEVLMGLFTIFQSPRMSV